MPNWPCRYGIRVHERVSHPCIPVYPGWCHILQYPLDICTNTIGWFHDITYIPRHIMDINLKNMTCYISSLSSLSIFLPTCVWKNQHPHNTGLDDTTIALLHIMFGVQDLAHCWCAPSSREVRVVRCSVGEEGQGHHTSRLSLDSQPGHWGSPFFRPCQHALGQTPQCMLGHLHWDPRLQILEHGVSASSNQYQ